MELGNLLSSLDVPQVTLDQRISEKIEAELDGPALLVLLHKMLAWRPEDRCSAAELLQDPWVSAAAKKW